MLKVQKESWKERLPTGHRGESSMNGLQKQSKKKKNLYLVNLLLRLDRMLGPTL